jgi:hypothetical protein
MGKIFCLIITVLFIIASMILIFNNQPHFDLFLGMALLFGMMTIFCTIREDL